MKINLINAEARSTAKTINFSNLAGIALITLSAMFSLFGLSLNIANIENESNYKQHLQRDVASDSEEKAIRDFSSEAPAKTQTYKITDGYGEYVGQGKTKLQASSNAREACIMQKVMAYESRHGTTPDADTADLFIDACINR
jgi:hypothetical protein